MKKICPGCGKEKIFTFSWERLCYQCTQERIFKKLQKTQEAIRNGEETDTGSSDYVICPYCGYAMDTRYRYEDFPELYEEDDHEIECPECEKTYIMNTSISYYYETRKVEDE